MGLPMTQRLEAAPFQNAVARPVLCNGHFTLPRTAGGRWMRIDGRLFAIGLAQDGSFSMRHGRGYSPLFFRGQQEDVIRQQLPMITHIALEGWRRRSGEYPLIILLLEKTRRH